MLTIQGTIMINDYYIWTTLLYMDMVTIQGTLRLDHPCMANIGPRQGASRVVRTSSPSLAWVRKTRAVASPS